MELSNPIYPEQISLPKAGSGSVRWLNSSDNDSDLTGITL